jgi:hypothetical protein
MNRIEITNIINAKIQKINTQISQNLEALAARIATVYNNLTFSFKTLYKKYFVFEFSKYKYVNLKENETSLIDVKIYSDVVYLHPYNYETALFCKEFINSLNLGITISSCDNIYTGSFKTMNLGFATSINIEKVLEDLKFAVYSKFGI